MATVPPSPERNAFPSTAPRLYRPLGFANGYRLALFLFFGGLMMFFSLERIKWYLDNVVCTRPDLDIPGECYWFSRGLERAGLYIHVVAILPAGFLACLQFIPALQRSKWASFHRISGYVVLVLSVIGTVGTLIIGRRAVGGTLVFQVGMVLSSAMFIVALAMAYTSIRRLQIDQHREWMLRAWFYAGFIVTMRPMLIAIALGISSPDSPYYQAMPCKIIDYIVHGSHEKMMQLAPGCAAYINGDNLEQWTAVQANWTDDNPVGETAAIQIAFMVSGWASFFIHAVGVEIYIHRTSAESERLRLLSKHRQMLREQGRSDANPGEESTKNQHAESLDLTLGSN